MLQLKLLGLVKLALKVFNLIQMSLFDLFILLTELLNFWVPFWYLSVSLLLVQSFYHIGNLSMCLFELILLFSKLHLQEFYLLVPHC